jgi:hypothetical protein
MSLHTDKKYTVRFYISNELVGSHTATPPGPGSHKRKRSSAKKDAVASQPVDVLGDMDNEYSGLNMTARQRAKQVTRTLVCRNALSWVLTMVMTPTTGKRRRRARKH